MYNFEFVKPASLADAIAALGREGAQALSGGQSLLPSMKMRLNQPEALVSLTGIAELKGVLVNGDEVTVGGATPHAVVARELATAYPAMAGLAARIGDPAVRNRGTIGGSLANNDPAACYPAGVLASNGVIVTDRREIAVDDFFMGMFTTALEEGEIITSVRFMIPKRAAYAKFIQPASRFSLTSVYVAEYWDGVRVAITGASTEGVFRWSEAEAALSESFTPEAIAGLTMPAGDLISDLHGTAEYRAHLCKVMTKRAVLEAI